MASKQAKKARPVDADTSDEGLDQAIGDLRGVLKKDAEGSAPMPGEMEAGDDMTAADSHQANKADDLANDEPPETFAPGEPDAPGGNGLDSDLPEATSPFNDESAALPASGPGRKPAASVGSLIPDADGPGVRSGRAPPNLDLVMDIPIDMQIVLGMSRLPVSGLMNLSEGALIGLDRKIGEPVDIMVNGLLFGRGEITVLEGDDTRFGVKLTEVLGDARK